MDKLTYIGLEIDEHGSTFSRDKKDSILDFPKPITEKQLKQFIGLASYFRTHVPNHSDIVRPLERMLTKHERSRKLEWTEETTNAFENIKQAINDCQKLHFLTEGGEIHLKTDACIYGIGAYLYQIVDGVERPIYLFSKSLSTDQLKWHIPEKEYFALWYTLKKLDYLIRDTHFILHTDHKNLTFLKTAGSDKVMQWKLDIQE